MKKIAIDFVISPFLSTSSFYNPGHPKNLRLCTFAWVEVPKSVFPRGAMERLCLQEGWDGSGMAMGDEGG